MNRIAEQHGGKVIHAILDDLFRSVPELIDSIERVIADYNDNARPLVWTKSVVH